MTVTLTPSIIISIASLLGALAALATFLAKGVRWFDRQKEQDAEIKKMREENALIIDTQFAVLDGLKQLGCNGNVTEAHDKLRIHLNKEAHS